MPFVNPAGPSSEIPAVKPLSQAPAGGDGFESDLAAAVSETRTAMRNADAATAEAIAGGGDLHQAMLAIARADLSLRLITQVRNKLLDAYHELMRTNL